MRFSSAHWYCATSGEWRTTRSRGEGKGVAHEQHGSRRSRRLARAAGNSLSVHAYLVFARLEHAVEVTCNGDGELLSRAVWPHVDIELADVAAERLDLKWIAAEHGKDGGRGRSGVGQVRVKHWARTVQRTGRRLKSTETSGGYCSSRFSGKNGRYVLNRSGIELNKFKLYCSSKRNLN